MFIPPRLLQDYIHRAYRFFYDEIEIASTHPDLEVRMWGPGFVGYDESESLNINIKKVFDEENHFQIIYAAASGQIQGTFSKTILVYSLGDCHDMLCLEELAPNIDVLGLRYSFEAMDL